MDGEGVLRVQADVAECCGWPPQFEGLCDGCFDRLVTLAGQTVTHAQVNDEIRRSNRREEQKEARRGSGWGTTT